MHTRTYTRALLAVASARKNERRIIFSLRNSRPFCTHASVCVTRQFTTPVRSSGGGYACVHVAHASFLMPSGSPRARGENRSIVTAQETLDYFFPAAAVSSFFFFFFAPIAEKNQLGKITSGCGVKDRRTEDAAR